MELLTFRCVPPMMLASIFAILLPGAAVLQAAAVPLDAQAIMARVAENQDHSEAERTHFIYVQHTRVTSRKGKTIRCEEVTDSRSTPSSGGSQQALLMLDGRMLVKGRYVTYDHMPESANAKNAPVTAEQKDIQINLGENEDRDLVENLRDNLTKRKSKDGLSAGLFPLTSRMQAKYLFHLLGEQPINGRQTFHLTFEPKDKTEYDWKGHAYIDVQAFQPVLIRTALARNVPFAVRTLLGTSVPGLGFTVVYAPQRDEVWFPVSFGTEFKMHVLFLFSREITLSAVNRDFEKTHVSSTITAANP